MIDEIQPLEVDGASSSSINTSGASTSSVEQRGEGANPPSPGGEGDPSFSDNKKKKKKRGKGVREANPLPTTRPYGQIYFKIFYIGTSVFGVPPLENW